MCVLKVILLCIINQVSFYSFTCISSCATDTMHSTFFDTISITCPWNFLAIFLKLWFHVVFESTKEKNTQKSSVKVKVMLGFGYSHWNRVLLTFTRVMIIRKSTNIHCLCAVLTHRFQELMMLLWTDVCVCVCVVDIYCTAASKVCRSDYYRKIISQMNEYMLIFPFVCCFLFVYIVIFISLWPDFEYSELT